MDKNAEDHLITLSKVFEKFREGNFKCRPEKVNLLQNKIKFLGVVVTQGQIAPDPEKVKIVENLKAPQTIKQLRGILGLCGYFRRFIRNYSQIAKPLTDLTRGKPQKINWSKEAQESLDYLKKALISEPILSLPNFQTGQFVVTTDASTKGIGAILSQTFEREENGKIIKEEKIIAYASRTLTPGEKNYSATMLELLSIIHHLDKFRHYLVGRKFKLRCDHKSLQYLQTFKKPT
jgi:hemolysin-activating ACP:hemolysin acyltransferase